MVSFHVLLGAEDQRDRLVDHIIVEKKNVLFFVSDSSRGALFKVDGSAEQLSRVLMKHAIGPDLADGFLSLVECHVVHIEHAAIGNCVGNICCKITLFADKFSPTAVVDLIAAKE